MLPGLIFQKGKSVIPPNNEQSAKVPRSHATHVHASRESFSAGTGQRLRWLVGLLIIALGAGFWAVHNQRSVDEMHLRIQAKEQSEARALVEVVRVKPTPAGQPLVLPGETAAWYESTIYAQVNGYVGTWTADIGDHVHKGQVLASIETPLLDADLAAAKAKLRASEAEVKVRESHVKFANSTYIRWRDSPKGVVSEQEQFDKKAQFESAEAELQAAEAQVNMNQAEVDRLVSFEHFKQVAAPYDGVITERRIDIGNLVSDSSSKETTPLYRMSQSDTVRVFVNVPQNAASDLMKIGTPAQVMFGDSSGRHYDGLISRTTQSVDPLARTLRVEIDLPNPNQDLLPGLYVQVGFQLPNDDTLQVPASAMVFRAKGPQVAVVDLDHRIHFVPVVIARDSGNFVEVSNGVKAGDKVVLNVSNQIVEGEQVQITNEDGSATGDVK